MTDRAKILAQCRAVEKCNFLEVLVKNSSISELYGIKGLANRATRISHYCTASTLKLILKNESLRFTDVRFLNDSTEFIEILRVIRNMLDTSQYSRDFRNFILTSREMSELEDYRQSYWKVSRVEHTCKPITYRTYTCSFSTDNNSLSMWNYYAPTGLGINIIFEHAWNMFEGSRATETNEISELENKVYMLRDIIIYDEDKKKKCVAALLAQLNTIYEEAKDNLDEYGGIIRTAFKEAVNHMRCFFKYEKFKDESEYRVAIMVPETLILNGDKSIKECGVFERGSNLIPYIDYRLKMESISGIVINPNKGEGSMLELGIKELLWMKGLNNVKVYSSDIPIRKYN